MKQNPLERKPKQEKLDIKVEIAKLEDWEEYKKIRLEAITGKDAGMFGPKAVEEDLSKTDEGWKKDLSLSDKFVVLAWQGKEAIGISIIKKKVAEGTWDIGAGYTKENFRGKVFARTALTKILSEIINRGGTRAILATRVENQYMTQLAELLGFKSLEIEDGWQNMELDLKNHQKN